ncbi:aspartate aminotransferase family protein [Chloroflexota bacterium]
MTMMAVEEKSTGDRADQRSVVVPTERIIEQEAQHIVHTYPRPPFVLDHGVGMTLYDTAGNAYLDMVAGIAVNALGYGDAELEDAISTQTGKLLHVSNLYHTAPQSELAAKLCDLSFADRVFFNNSGSEANETAIKFARKWAYVNQTSDPENKGWDYIRAHHVVDRAELVTFSSAFHGRTAGALSLTPREKYQKAFRPLLPNVKTLSFNDLEAATKAIWQGTCAVFVEPLQGEGGIHEATPEFLQGLRKLCDEHGALLIFDEVQCGVGRTGTLWAHEAAGVTPDMMTLAKPLAGGLPIGAVLVTEKIASVIQPGDHGSTFAGGPVVCAAANVVLDRISDPEFLAHVDQVGAYFKERLSEINSPLITDVRGRGLMLAVELSTANTPAPAGDVVAAGYEHGLLLVNAGPETVRFVPPLIIEKAHVDELIEKLTVILAEMA